MNNLQTELCKILDFTEKQLSLVEEEADKKLKSTWMFVNGKLEYILKIFPQANKITIEDSSTGDILDIKVKTLSVFLPEAGQYLTQHGHILSVTKIPKRQWLKSFSENYYKVEIIHINKNSSIKIHKIKELSLANKKDIVITENQNIIYNGQNIGYIENKTIVCKNTRFFQELLDWNKYAKSSNYPF